MPLISLKNALLEDTNLVGELARDLSKAINLGFKVPNGIVITSDYFKELLDLYGLRIKIENAFKSIEDKQELAAKLFMYFQEIQKDIEDQHLSIFNEAYDIICEDLGTIKPKIIFLLPSTTEKQEEIFNLGSQLLISKSELKEKVLDLYASSTSIPFVSEGTYCKEVAVVLQEVIDYDKFGFIYLDKIDSFFVLAQPGIPDITNLYLLQKKLKEANFDIDEVELYSYKENVLHLLNQEEKYIGIFKQDSTIIRKEYEGRILNDKEVLEVIRVFRRIRKEQPEIYKMLWAYKGEELYIIALFRRKWETLSIKEESIVKEVIEEDQPQEEPIQENEIVPIEEDLSFLEEIEKIEKIGSIEEEIVPKEEGEAKEELEKQTVVENESSEIEKDYIEIDHVEPQQEQQQEQQEQVEQEEISLKVKVTDIKRNIFVLYSSLLSSLYVSAQLYIREKYPWIKDITREELIKLESEEKVNAFFNLKNLYEQMLQGYMLSSQDMISAIRSFEEILS